MANKLIKLVVLVAVFVLVGFSSEAKTVDKIIATVNGKPITTYELQNLAGFYRVNNLNTLLNEVIDDYLIRQYANNMGIIVSDEDVEKYIQQMAEANNLSEDEFLAKLKESNIDLNYYKEGIKLRLYRIKFARRVFLSSIKITDKDIENYYNLHKDKFKGKSKVLVLSIITLGDLETAKKVYSLLKKGKSFEDLLNKYSTTKESTRKVPIETLNPYLQKKLLSLKPNQYTDIIQSAGKFYIVKLLGTEEGESIKDTIRNTLIDQQITAKLKSWLKMIRARSDIEVFQK
ncbi:peptidyl-prolyl cis-trans isomerase [Hippea maritima]|uniref:peptidylprolyl isomerase n=1 Tax=Hippea maritima (strain ATCC 700847 / DSM 10411 / MH2) TaxID=760142 RepID=F2LWP3_HIPMA|nr:peptidyl-prolyl cis-trans isomerase [Hippea maritima]AEA33021.1 SurA domain protein [Hippea maritima DSM 10411]